MRNYAMTKMFALIVVMIAALSLAQPDKNTPKKLDGMNLLRACGGEDGAVGDGYCLGVIRGVDFWLLPKGCSDDVGTRQRIMVVNKYLKDHPEDLNLPDALLVSVALSKAFPCAAAHIK
jgi:hypothetical protein